MRHADRAEPHIGVAQHHALGPPGRARGVEQGREIVGIVVATGRSGVGMIEQAPRSPSSSRIAQATSPGSSVARRAAPLISRPAPLSARMWATCIRFSSGLTGTWISPARAQASGSRLVRRFLGSQEATRSPCARPLRLQRRRQRADRRLQPGIIERALARQQRRRGRRRRAASGGRADSGVGSGVSNFIPA